MTVALINNKGGVGKTTTAVNLAHALASKLKVLLIDLDSQGSASFSLGVARDELRPSIAECILRGSRLANVIRPSSIPNVDLVCATLDLTSVDMKLGSQTGREEKLLKCIEPVKGDYDLILLDCPPSFSLLVVNALVCADHYLVPLAAQYLSLEGLINLNEAIETLAANMSRVPHRLGILLTMFDQRTNNSHQVEEILRTQYGREVFTTRIPHTVRLAEAPSHGQTIFQYDPFGLGAIAYRELAVEVISRLRKAARS
jgi:chromosome partitioning protein